MNEFMSQEEIDALLKGKETEETTPADSPQVELSEMETDTIGEVANISMGSAATALSTMVNRKVKITVPTVEISTPADVRENYPLPCIIVDVRYVAGLQGSNLLVIKERDAAVIGNLMMGEDGSNPPTEIDELYLSAVTEAMNMMMGSAATSMSDLFKVTIDISPPTTLQRNLASEKLELGDDDRPVVVVAFRIEIEGLVDSTMLQVLDVDFAKELVGKLVNSDSEDSNARDLLADNDTWDEEDTFPDQAAEPAEVGWDDLQQDNEQVELPFEQTTAQQVASLGNLNVDLIKDIPVQVRAILGRTRMPIDDILKLGPGHIMELETLEGEPIDVYANDTLIARGEVVVVEEQYGIRITEIATPRDRINSVR